MAKATPIMLGILGAIVVVLGVYPLIMISMIPAGTIMSSTGTIQIATFYTTDIFAGITFVIVGVAIILIAIGGNFK